MRQELTVCIHYREQNNSASPVYIVSREAHITFNDHAWFVLSFVGATVSIGITLMIVVGLMAIIVSLFMKRCRTRGEVT